MYGLRLTRCALDPKSTHEVYNVCIDEISLEGDFRIELNVLNRFFLRHLVYSRLIIKRRPGHLLLEFKENGGATYIRCGIKVLQPDEATYINAVVGPIANSKRALVF